MPRITEPQAFVVPESVHELEVEIIEIDENLCRSDLTAAQRAASVKRRKEVWEALGRSVKEAPEPDPDGSAPSATSCRTRSEGGKFAPGNTEQSSGKSFPTTDTERVSKRGRVGEGRPQEFAAETSELTGQSKRAINQHLARAESLGDDLPRISGTSLDKGVELDALSFGELRLVLCRPLLKCGCVRLCRRCNNGDVLHFLRLCHLGIRCCGGLGDFGCLFALQNGSNSGLCILMVVPVKGERLTKDQLHPFRIVECHPGCCINHCTNNAAQQNVAKDCPTCAGNEFAIGLGLPRSGTCHDQFAA